MRWWWLCYTGCLLFIFLNSIRFSVFVLFTFSPPPFQSFCRAFSFSLSLLLYLSDSHEKNILNSLELLICFHIHLLYVIHPNKYNLACKNVPCSVFHLPLGATITQIPWKAKPKENSIYYFMNWFWFPLLLFSTATSFVGLDLRVTFFSSLLKMERVLGRWMENAWMNNKKISTTYQYA